VLALALTVVAGFLGRGVTATVPAGWHLVRQPVEESSCDPVQRLALATYRLPLTGASIASVPRGEALVIVLEDHVNPRAGYHRKRPRIRLAWTRPSRFEGCCGLPTAPGWELFFRSHRRDLIVLVHAGPHLGVARRAQILSILASVEG
jgi:hypothetical protein